MADVGEDENQQESENNGEFNWELMFEFGAAYDPSIYKDVEYSGTDYLNLSIYIDLYYKGFFLRSIPNRSTSDLGEIGYELIAKEDWGLDLIFKFYIEGYEYKELLKDQDLPIPALEGLEDKDDGDGYALRYSKYQENTVLTVELARLNIDREKEYWLFESYYSHLIPYKNWDIYLGAGLTFYSHNISDYYLSINSNEISPLRNEYQAGSGFEATVEISAQYPISKNWSFNAGMSQSYFSGGIADSPIFERQNLTQFRIGIRYVL